jgi:hypothetical protein
MAQSHVSFNEVPACSATPGSSEAAFDAALLREQYRALTRLGPYVHGVIIVAALALFGATAPTGWLLKALPAALIAVSLFRLVSWFQARANVELEALDVVRRKVRAASLLGPALTLAFALTAAISTWQDGVVEFALALVTVWVIAAVCAMCLAGEARAIIIAATAPLIVAFLARGAELTFVLAPLVAIVSCFVIRMLHENFRMFAEIVRSRFLIAESQRAAEEARQAAMTVALTDELTGLPNRRCFQNLLADRIRTATETGESFALVDRSRQIQTHQRRSWARRRRRDSQTSRRTAHGSDGRTRLSREARRRRIRHPLQWDRRSRTGCRARPGNPGDLRDAARGSAAWPSFDLRLRLCALSLLRRRAERTGASGRRRALPRQG